MNEIAISLKNLSYSFRSNWLYQSIECLHDISLDIYQGEAFGFLGQNGAGKTTTIKCILNLLHPREGSIEILQQNSKDPGSRKFIGYIPEQPYFYDHLTVLETMEMYATLAGVASSARKSAVTKALNTVGLSARSKSPLRSLSKGLTQRVALAQAIVADPKILILDEPFSGLDPVGRKEFADIFRTLKGQGVTLFISSHILKDIEYLCDRASILIKGQLKAIYQMDEISNLTHGEYELVLQNNDIAADSFKDATSREVSKDFLRLCFLDEMTAQKALKFAIENSFVVRSFQFNHGGLEELFIKLVGESANS